MIKRRLFVDMDGTLAEFKQISSMEMLFEKGYFLNLKPLHTVIDAVKYIINNHPDIEVKILSAVLDSKYAEAEKNQWLDTHLPEIKNEDRIFTKYGEDKTSYIHDGVRPTDYLLDDFTKNLVKWQEYTGKGIKLLNGINNTNNTWEGSRIRFNKLPEDIAKNIVSIMLDNVLYIDKPLVRDFIIKLYSSEFPAIKYIKEETAHLIDQLCRNKDCSLTVKDIRQAYKSLGKYLELGTDKSLLQEFKMLQVIVDDLKNAQLIEKQIQAQQKNSELPQQANSKGGVLNEK